MNCKKISVCIITYNQVNYIKKTIESVLLQKVNFKFEIVIADDFSTDGTREVILEYSKRYPELIKLIFQDKNVGPSINWKELISYPKSEFIAYIEGDDYWTNPNKLQKQVDFLEENSDYVLSFHKVEILNSENKIVEDFITKVPNNYESIETLASLGNYIHSPSIVFRNVIDELPIEIMSSPLGDYFMNMLLARHGKLKYFNNTMAVYRYGVGIHSKSSDFKINWNTAITFSLLISYFNREEENNIAKIFLYRLSILFNQYYDTVTKIDLLKLDNNKLVNELIFDVFTTKRVQFFNESYQRKTTKQLLNIILVRIKKRVKIWF